MSLVDRQREQQQQQSAVAAKPSRDPTTFANMGFVELIYITYKSDTRSHLSRFETDLGIEYTYMDQCNHKLYLLVISQ